jgi:hypothetical protein
MPVVKDSYENEAEAQVAADKLQSYIDEYEATRRPSRRRRKRRTDDVVASTYFLPVTDVDEIFVHTTCCVVGRGYLNWSV